MNGKSPLALFFSVAIRGRTWLRLSYLVVSFPLAIVSFVIVVTGVCVGAGTVPIVLGLLVLFAIFGMQRGLLFIDRKLAGAFVTARIDPPAWKKPLPGPWNGIKAAVTDPLSWKGVLYFIAKLFLSIFTFTAGIGLLSVSVTLAFLPLFLLIRRGDELDDYIARAWDYPVLIAIAVVAGVFLLFATLHATNGLASLHGRLLEAKWGGKKKRS